MLSDALMTNDYDEEELLILLDSLANQAQADPTYDPGRWKVTIGWILQTAPEPDQVKRPGLLRRLLSPSRAAVIIALLGLSTYFILFHKPSKEIANTQIRFKNDVAPGSNKAMLILGNGSAIILDSIADGTLARQGNAAVIKTDSSKLSYLLTDSGLPLKPKPPTEYNTLTTPRGGQFQLVLSDGTRIWLNAASSIRYPVSFGSKERRVEITGEVYFEVARNELSPFIVSAGGEEVQVLGTHFNIRAYPDETELKTTLLEGSVKVTSISSHQSEIIKPKQQTWLQADRLSVINEVNTDEVIAWKQGTFYFKSADLKTILREFARWYDIDISYEGPVKNRKFFAVVKRSNTLKKMLEMLQDNSIIYEIDGKKLIVKSE